MKRINDEGVKKVKYAWGARRFGERVNPDNLITQAQLEACEKEHEEILDGATHSTIQLDEQFCEHRLEVANWEHKEKVGEIFQVADEMSALILLCQEELDKWSVRLHIKPPNIKYFVLLKEKAEEWQALKQRFINNASR